MAIRDFQSRVSQDELALEELLAKRKQGIGGIVDQTRQGIEGARTEAFGPVLQGKLAGLGVTGSVDTSFQTDKLGRGLDEVLGNQKYGMQRERVNLSYNKALNAALDAGKSRREAEAFATQFMQDEIRRQNEGSLAEKRREQLKRKSDLENTARAKGQEMELSGMDDGMAEYQQAVIRILSGMPSQLLSMYALNGGFGGGNTTPMNPGTNVVGQGNTLFQQSGSVPRGYKSYGR